jgi:hypothetical protein
MGMSWPWFLNSLPRPESGDSPLQKKPNRKHLRASKDWDMNDLLIIAM